MSIVKSPRLRCSGLMVSALDSGLSGPGSSPIRGHCVVLLGKTIYSHSASVHPDVQMSIAKCNAWGNPACDALASHPGGSIIISSCFMLQKLG